MKSKDELNRMIEHITYEREMLDYCVRRLNELPYTKAQLDRESERLWWAFLECFLLHSRNLIHFLFAKRINDKSDKKTWSVSKTDIFAEDFIENGCWSGTDRLDDSQKDQLFEWNKRINKRLVHITTNRSASGSDREEWRIKEMHDIIRNEYFRFTTLVSGEFTNVLCEAQDSSLFLSLDVETADTGSPSRRFRTFPRLDSGSAGASPSQERRL